MDFDIDDYINFPGDPTTYNTGFDTTCVGLCPSDHENWGLYPHNSSNFELDGRYQTQDPSSFAPSLDYSSAATPQLQDFNDLEALLEPFDYSSLSSQHELEDLLQIPKPCHYPGFSNSTALLPNSGNNDLLRITAQSELDHVLAYSDSFLGEIVSPVISRSSIEQGPMISLNQSSHIVRRFFFLD
jgi:hypothetical protein